MFASYAVLLYMWLVYNMLYDGYVWHKDRNHMKSPTHIAALSYRFSLIKPRCEILNCGRTKYSQQL